MRGIPNAVRNPSSPFGKTVFVVFRKRKSLP
jgi:hypothetical protein